MAELIDKGELIDWVQAQREEVTKKQVVGQDYIFTREVLVTMQRDISTFETEINSLQTTTEAEIRAKAIDDFVEHINLPLTTEEDITKILEQLKEE